MRSHRQITCLQLFLTTISSREMLLGIDPRQVVWKRCVDMNDRVLRNVVVGLGNKMDGMVREDHFVITVASEIMAILMSGRRSGRSEKTSWQNHCCLYIFRRTGYS